MTDSSQKFIARNRAPRVQIEYDVELYGAEKKVQLPFVMGVMSDLSGKSRVAQPSVGDRSFLEIDVDNFDSRMKAMQPRAAFTVPNTLTGEGNMSVDLTFEKMDDFSPAAIASKVDALRPLLEARTQLSDLMAYMDGKTGAEALIEKILADTGVLTAISTPPVGDNESDAALANLRVLTPADTVEENSTAGVLDGLRQIGSDGETKTANVGSVLDSLAAVEVTVGAEGGTDDVLAGVAKAAPEELNKTDAVGHALDSLASVNVTESKGKSPDDLLAELAADMPDEDETAGESSDEILAGLTRAEDDSELDDLTETDETDSALDGLLVGLVDESDVIAGEADSTPNDVLADDGEEIGTDELDDLLVDLDDDPVIAGENADSDLDDLLGDLDVKGEALEFAYGRMSADRPAPERLNRKRFRLAILGDFSGRAARGMLETGDALAARAPILLDTDTVEDVIESFATDLVLPIGKDGAGVAVKLGGMDDLHPDELYENVELFAELVGLRNQLASGATADHAAQMLRAWGEKHGKAVAPTRAKSSGNTVPADLKLSDFQKLIGDTTATLTQPSPIEDLLARIVGPFIRAVPDADAVAMQGAVDDALSAAMRLVLHHPEFQSLEAQWRSLDLIARSVETDDTLDVVLYDISAEEIAADLAMANDLATSGFVRLLTEGPLDEENGRGGYSALMGLYTFEETPPHAEILGRIARVAAHVDAPFFAAISPAFLDTEKPDRHPLVATAWDTLRAMPEAKHLGIVSPRFLLRRPYGVKSEPIYEFAFEEFTMAEGLGGMLWANPVVLVAILLAKSFRENGANMALGSIMSLGDMPYHFVTDRYGDQVALPCTERNLTLDKVEKAVVRGYMSVVSIKGRDEVRLASFQSLGGGEILGPWSGVAAPDPSPQIAAPAGNETNTGTVIPDETDLGDANDDDDVIDLDDLLASFADDTDDDSNGGDDLDAELAALLEGL